MQAGNRVRITAQLIHAPTDKHLWVESYEREMTDILALQNKVASAIAQEIQIKLTPQEKAQITSTLKVNPAAYEAYLRGINYIRRSDPTEEQTRLAITMFERAIEIDPNFSLAYGELSIARSWMYFEYDRNTETLSKSKQALDRAFQIKPVLPETHVAFGYYYYWGFMNYEQALHEFRIAQKSIPNDKQLLIGFAAIYRRQGKFEEALEGFKKILELDPRNDQAADEVGTVYGIIGKYAEAQRYSDLAISLAPDNSVSLSRESTQLPQMERGHERSPCDHHENSRRKDSQQ
ncbi:tetratricopeptide repeat protein [bacterium]|nr:tetratricopeptide repeat protein [bacterium]